MKLGDIHWGELAAIGAVWTFFTGILVVVLRPWFDKSWMRSFERNKVEIMAVANDWYNVTEERRIQGQLEADHKDLFKRFGELVVSNEKEREEIRELFDRAMADQNRSLERIAEQMERASNSISHIYGLLNQEPWDGKTERRIRERRDR